MFRFFLTKKLFSGESRGVTGAHRPNRRMNDRFSFDRKRMTMMSDQDIMVVREVSSSGFSSLVSERAWERMNPGDGFSARVRIGSEILQFDIRVAWKDVIQSGDPVDAAFMIGFELMHNDSGSEDSWRRLIRPASIAGTLRRVESAFMEQYGSSKVWYRGEEGCDLMIWSGSEDGGIVAWRLSFDGRYVEWRSGIGFETGESSDLFHTNLAASTMPRSKGLNETTSKPDHRRLVEALDILSASEISESGALIGLLEGELIGNGQKRRSDIG
jgi:hypothetical protein